MLFQIEESECLLSKYPEAFLSNFVGPHPLTPKCVLVEKYIDVLAERRQISVSECFEAKAYKFWFANSFPRNLESSGFIVLFFPKVVFDGLLHLPYDSLRELEDLKLIERLG